MSEISKSVTGRIKDLCQIPDNQGNMLRWDKFIQQETDAAEHAAHDPAKKTAETTSGWEGRSRMCKKKAPAFRRCKALVILIEQLMTLVKFKAYGKTASEGQAIKTICRGQGRRNKSNQPERRKAENCPRHRSRLSSGKG